MVEKKVEDNKRRAVFAKGRKPSGFTGTNKRIDSDQVNGAYAGT